MWPLMQSIDVDSILDLEDGLSEELESNRLLSGLHLVLPLRVSNNLLELLSVLELLGDSLTLELSLGLGTRIRHCRSKRIEIRASSSLWIRNRC